MHRSLGALLKLTIKCSSLNAVDEDQLRPSSFGAGEPNPGISRAGLPPQFGHSLLF